MESWLLDLQSLQGFPAYALVFFLLVACGIGAPMNEDIVLLVASALTLSGVMEPLPLIVVAWFGLILGDLIAFHWGHRFGPRLLRTKFFSRIVSEQRLVDFQQLFFRYGPAYIFVIRFLPGIRTALFFAAGSLKLPYRYLLIYDGAAALIELPLLIYAVRYVGGRWRELLLMIQQFQVYLLIGMLMLLIFFLLQRRNAAQRIDQERMP